MLNPVLKDIYSDKVIVALSKMSEYFEGKGVKAYVFGVKGTDIGLRAPIDIFYNNPQIKEEESEIIFQYARLYQENLTDKEDEILGGIKSASDERLWGMYKEKSELLWV